MMQAKDVTIAIGRKILIEHVSLTVTPGQLVAVVGPNGAGKSTLLKAICGEQTMRQGEIRLNERPLSDWSSKEQAQLRAVLPQSSTLNFGFRVMEVVLMGRSPHIDGTESTRDYEVVFDALDAVAMSEFAERVYTTLSGGEQQRVQLARVLAQIWDESPHGARYLLLDEPTNNLDLAHQHATLRIARQFSRNGSGVLAILHDLNLAAQYADQVVILKGGRILADGTPKAVLNSTTIEEAFDMPVTVIEHPTLDCPLIVSDGINE
ncbi:MAG: heme ABC transporter ATP-binding protein [Chloroflexota bacterium]